jgi:murein DD-endopeptidase MepM/ murein hydrolase activator NlpD
MGMYSTTTGGTVSADLLVQEIAARKIGLARLIKQVRNHQDEVARIPSAWPLTSRARQISSSFGYRKDPFTYRVSFHSGLDLRGPVGLPVLATAKGQVTYSGYDGEWGNIVRVDHGNGIVTFYAHLSHTRVKVGAVVERGETVGTLGNTGRSTGSHLHYEIIVSGRSVDPEKYL